MATIIDRPEGVARAAGVGGGSRSVGFFATLIPFLVFFTIAFPKGGVRLYEIPITFGYLLTPLMIGGALLRGRSTALPINRLVAFLPAAVMSIWSGVVVAVNGTDAFGYTTSYFISAAYLPLFGLIFFSDLTMSDRRDAIERSILWAVRFIVAYGIFLFLFRLLSGRWIEIPYLTVNADDVGTLDSKYIDRGGIFKLISTYNNGNIFGVTVCVLAPLYLWLEKRRLPILMLYGALFLTLSRTVWIGLILVLVLRSLSNRVRPMTLIYLAAALLASGVAIYYLLDFLGRDLSFVFDKTLGNRAAQLNVFNDPRVIPDQVTKVLPEIVYTGVLGNYGYPGLAMFVVHLLAPSAILLAQGVKLLSRSPASACLQGLLIYPVLAASDSAYILTPVMMIFWMVAGLGFWYARPDHGVRDG